MSGRALAVVLVILGLVLMANPLYLPVAVGEPTHVYTHVVQPVGPDTPASDDGDVVDRADLDADAREAFDRALEAEDGGFVLEDPDARPSSLSYPTDPTPGDGLLIVAHEGERYEFWTRTVERDPGPVVAQRVVVQPIAFLVGFLGIVAAVAISFRGRLDE